MNAHSNSFVFRPRPPAAVPSQPRLRAIVLSMRRTPGQIARFTRIAAEIWREWHSNEKCMRALAELDDDDLHNLSEAGRRLRREARRQLRPY